MNFHTHTHTHTHTRTLLYQRSLLGYLPPPTPRNNRSVSFLVTRVQALHAVLRLAALPGTESRMQSLVGSPPDTQQI